MGFGTKVNCRLCRHYYITWDPRNPNGCRAMGFKARLMPSTHVVKTSGFACVLFEPRPRAKGR
ncbi:MAG: uracil-DNA glycosylase [Candidatus Adiutrix sp.]|nr:uracil-DNA glycosylase [Candidatus Adiutrix sp.]